MQQDKDDHDKQMTCILKLLVTRIFFYFSSVQGDAIKTSAIGHCVSKRCQIFHVVV